MNPFKSRIGTFVAGIVASLIIIFALKSGNGGNPLEWTVWFHVVVGIAWVGILYYFNAVQVPAVGEALADEGGPGPAGINKYVAPRALFWFRWAALLTWLSGLSALTQVAQYGGGMQAIVKAFTFQMTAPNLIAMSIGIWLGTIMLINVWMIIWPNQRRILGLNATASSADEIASAKVKALMASRINTFLSFPMLLGMTAFGHGMPL